MVSARLPDDLCDHLIDVNADIDRALTQASDHFRKRNIQDGIFRLTEAKEMLQRSINRAKAAPKKRDKTPMLEQLEAQMRKVNPELMKGVDEASKNALGGEETHIPCARAGEVNSTRADEDRRRGPIPGPTPSGS